MAVAVALTQADLHTRLRALAPPADLAPHAEAAVAGDAIVHQDLHPGNVLLYGGFSPRNSGTGIDADAGASGG